MQRRGIAAKGRKTKPDLVLLLKSAIQHDPHDSQLSETMRSSEQDAMLAQPSIQTEEATRVEGSQADSESSGPASTSGRGNDAISSGSSQHPAGSRSRHHPDQQDQAVDDWFYDRGGSDLESFFPEVAPVMDEREEEEIPEGRRRYEPAEDSERRHVERQPDILNELQEERHFVISNATGMQVTLLGTGGGLSSESRSVTTKCLECLQP